MQASKKVLPLHGICMHLHDVLQQNTSKCCPRQSPMASPLTAAVVGLITMDPHDQLHPKCQFIQTGYCGLGDTHPVSSPNQQLSDAKHVHTSSALAASKQLLWADVVWGDCGLSLQTYRSCLHLLRLCAPHTPTMHTQRERHISITATIRGRQCNKHLQTPSLV